MKFPQRRLSYKSGQEQAQGLPGRLPPGQPLPLLLRAPAGGRESKAAGNDAPL